MKISGPIYLRYSLGECLFRALKEQDTMKAKEAMYLDLLKTRPPDEIVDVIGLLIDLLRHKGCTVIGKLEITKDE